MPTLINTDTAYHINVRVIPNIKQKWVDALRSGAYAPCDSVLGDDSGKFCTLGVLYAVIDSRFAVTGAFRHIDKYLNIPDKIQAVIAAKHDACMDFNVMADFIENHLSEDLHRLLAEH